MKHDPIEQTQQYKIIEKELEQKIYALIGEPGKMGYCYLYWHTKKEILKKDYNIDWKSPSELNPGILFD